MELWNGHDAAGRPVRFAGIDINPTVIAAVMQHWKRWLRQKRTFQRVPRRKRKHALFMDPGTPTDSMWVHRGLGETFAGETFSRSFQSASRD